MTGLYNCPLCGAADGYTVENHKFSRVNLDCLSCGGTVITVKIELIDPEIYYRRKWNESGAYAHRMKLGHDKWEEFNCEAKHA